MIDSLETRLHSVMDDGAMVHAMLRGIDAFDRYRTQLPVKTDGYTRTLLYKTSGFELVAMLWSPKSVSPIHDHGESRCWVVVMEGMLDVENYDRRDEREMNAEIVHASSMTVNRGELDHRLSWRELHRVRNTGTAGAYSLQLYAPSLTTYTVVQEESGICRTVPALYDSLFDL